MNNICRFIPYDNIPDVIHTVNFVYETKPQTNDIPKILSTYRMHYVTEGSGIIRISGKELEVCAGDIFFIFPALPHTIESKADFKYIYISYLGVRANQIMNKLRITADSVVFPDCDKIGDFFRNALEFQNDIIDLISESALLYAFSVIGEKLTESKNSEKPSSENILLVKKYIDDNFSDSELTLEKISEEFSYNKKYLSSTFKKHIGIGITEYRNTIRIQHACSLMKQKHSTVKEIAYFCGFSDPMYFSKVFKEKTGMSPKKYISEI